MSYYVTEPSDSVVGYSGPLNRRGSGAVDIAPFYRAGKWVGQQAYGIYKRERDKKISEGTPFLRGKKANLSKQTGLSSVSAQMSYSANSGSRWKKTFKSRRLSKSRRKGYKKRFIRCRNKRVYLSKWTVASVAAAGTDAGLNYRYSVIDVSPKDILQTMVVADSATAPGGTVVLDRSQKVFMSKWKKDVYIKNPYSIGINYRIVWTNTEITDNTATLDVIEPWTPVFHHDSWKALDEKFMRQDVGYLSADEDIMLHSKGFGQFIKMTPVDSRKLTFRMHIWLWSELQVQKGSSYGAATTQGYIDVNPSIFYRDCFNFVVDQGLTINDNIQHGYVAGMVAITAPLVKSEDKMIADS